MNVVDVGEYWPWWIGAIALAAVTIGFWALLDRPLGVSGSWSRVVAWRKQRRLAKAEASLVGVDVEDALLKATLAEFGEAALQQIGAPTRASAPGRQANVPARAGLLSHVTFLLSLAGGGLLAVWSTAGELAVGDTLGATHVALFGDGLWMWAALIGGGVLVGFGTQMAGGCSSGHGLSGCSNLVPPSLLATAVFFGMGVAISLILAGALT